LEISRASPSITMLSMLPKLQQIISLSEASVVDLFCVRVEKHAVSCVSYVELLETDNLTFHLN
jgi:hypothetical protein